jgi:hypothetical protein
MDFDLAEEPVWQGVVEEVILRMPSLRCTARAAQAADRRYAAVDGSKFVVNRDRRLASRTLDARMRQFDESIRPPMSASSASVDPEQAFALREAIPKVRASTGRPKGD